MNIREELKKASEAGLSIAAVAKRIGVDPSALQKWVRGDRGLKKENQEKVAEELLRRKGLWENIMID